jgi:hypothetical protein
MEQFLHQLQENWLPMENGKGLSPIRRLEIYWIMEDKVTNHPKL